MRSIMILSLALTLAIPVGAQFPLDPGEAILTCFSDNNNANPVVGLFDIRNPSANAPGFNTNWNAPHGAQPTWTRQSLGEVFGIALDDASPPNIYLTSTTVYTTTVVTQTAPGTGQVFKINGITGVAAPLGAALPNTGQGLGNIAFDPSSKDLFVTNFYDGKIYRIDRNSGNVQATFDPFAQFDSTQSTPKGYVPLAERIFGIAVHDNRVWYGRWLPSEVWSIDINFSGSPALEVVVGPLGNSVNAIADIEFTKDGEMLVAERGMQGTEVLTAPHHSRVLKYTPVGTGWTPSTHTYSIGSSANNSSGGVDSTCPTENDPAYVIMTGDALQLTSAAAVYGIQITPITGGTVNNSYLVDADANISIQDKTQIGDVDVYSTCDQCSEVTVEELLCTVDGTGDFILRFRIKNLSGVAAHHLYLVGLPPGVSATQTYFPLTGGLQPGQTSAVLQTRIHGASAGQMLSFKLTLHQQNFELCCAEDVTVTLPDCECAQVTDDRGPSCNLFSGYSYTFSLQNLFNGPAASYVLITPDTPSTATFSPNVIDLRSNPMNYGQTRTFTVNIHNAAAGSQVCFLVSTHNENFDECCAIRRCVTLPTSCWWTYYDFDDLIVHGDTTKFIQGDFIGITSPSDEPDCTFPLAPDTTSVDLEWEPIPTPLAIGSFIEQRFEGAVDGGETETIATTRTVRTGADYELLTSFPALDATRYTYAFLNDGELVGSVDDVAANAPVRCDGCGEEPPPTTDSHWRTILGDEPRLPIDESHCPQFPSEIFVPPPPCTYIVYTTLDRPFLVPGFSSAFLADEVRVYPEDGTFTSIDISALRFTAHGVRSITFTSLDVFVEPGGSPDFVRSLSTGFDQQSGAVLPGGAEDPEWRLANILTVPVPSRVVTNPIFTWQPAFAESKWISANANAGESLPSTDRLDFENCFGIPSDFTSAQLDLQLRADDIITGVFLNGTSISTGGGTFFGDPLEVQFSGAVGGAGPFVAGENCLSVKVHDFGGVVTGLNVSGSVRASTPTP